MGFQFFLHNFSKVYKLQSALEGLMGFHFFLQKLFSFGITYKESSFCKIAAMKISESCTGNFRKIYGGFYFQKKSQG